MVVHTFAFRWKAGVREDQKVRALAEIRGLQGQIPGLLETWVGVNVSSRSQGYELGGVMKFSDRSALDTYGAHPIHQKRSEEHTSELQSQSNLVCRLLLEKKK